MRQKAAKNTKYNSDFRRITEPETDWWRVLQGSFRAHLTNMMRQKAVNNIEYYSDFRSVNREQVEDGAFGVPFQSDGEYFRDLLEHT